VLANNNRVVRRCSTDHRLSTGQCSLGFEGDVTALDDKVHLHRLPDRYTLVKEGESLNKLFFVIHGSIVSYMKEIAGAKKERRTFCRLD
jgi:CRP-like cAMP-binding protein